MRLGAGHQTPRVLSACHTPEVAVYPLGKREAPRDPGQAALVCFRRPDGKRLRWFCRSDDGGRPELSWVEDGAHLSGHTDKVEDVFWAAGSRMMSRFSDWQQGRLAPFKEMRDTGRSGQGRGWWRDPVGS